MLVLGRRIGDVIWIGDHIKVVVWEIAGGVIRLGIDAPRDVPILREEVYQQIARGKDEAKPGSEPR